MKRKASSAASRPRRSAAPIVERGDAEQTRRRVLSVARSEFAAKGFAGARMDEIAERASINKQVIYYHFGNKDDLFRATLELCYEEISRQNAKYAAEASIKPAHLAMTRLIEHMFDRVARHSEVIDLIMDENRYKGRHLTNKKLVSNSDDPMIAHIEAILAEGKKSKTFGRRLDAAQLFLDIISLCIYYFSHIYTVSAVMDRDLAATAAIAKRRKHVTELIMSSVRSR